MKTRFLFPNKFRRIGFAVFGVGILVYLASNISLLKVLTWDFEQRYLGHEWNYEIIFNDTLLLTFITGLLLIGFTKEKIEDEQISQLRLDALQWAIYLNYLVLIICVIFFNGLNFFSIMVYNMLTPLILFIIRFRWKMFRLNQSLKTEEQ